MSDDQTPLLKISPALEIITSRPLDPAHSEFGGIAKQVQWLLTDLILTDEGSEAYLAELRHFPFPCLSTSDVPSHPKPLRLANIIVGAKAGILPEIC